MVLADTIGILLIVLGTLAATSMLWLFHLALWPDVVEEAGMKFTHSPIKSFFVGLPCLILTIVLVGALSKMGKGANELAVLVLLSLFLFVASMGVSGFAAKIGERLDFDNGRKWKPVFFGGLVLEFTFLFPVLGWILVFPLVSITGFGASLRALISRRRTR